MVSLKERCQPTKFFYFVKHLFEKMLSVIEPDGAENFSIGQIIQVRELKVPISDNRRRLDITTIQIVS